MKGLSISGSIVAIIGGIILIILGAITHQVEAGTIITGAILFVIGLIILVGNCLTQEHKPRNQS